MHISRYQKLFGVGPLSAAIGLALLVVFWSLDRRLGHVTILAHPKPLTLAGWALLGIWICWHIWCLRTIRLWWRDGQLCTSGPYRIVRHPIYAGAVILAFPGISLLFNSWIMLLSPVLQYIVLSLLVRREEAMMEAVFGERYKQYARHTGRLLPRRI